MRSDVGFLEYYNSTAVDLFAIRSGPINLGRKTNIEDYMDFRKSIKIRRSIHRDG